MKYRGLLFGLVLLVPCMASATVVRTIEFPVNGPNSFRNDFGEPRGGGRRLHQGNDIIALKMTPLVSTVDGKVLYVVSPQASWGYEIVIVDAEGYQYVYLHINNDNPETDDGLGGEAHAYAQGITSGVSVTKGQLIGWVGDSGNAENTVPHLHFEIHDPQGGIVNPYDSLIIASGAYRSSNNSLGVTVDMRSALDGIADGRPDDVFKRNLEPGSRGEDVRQLQITLKVLDLLTPDSITSYFGPKTRVAVMAFQKRQGIEQLGIAGPKTRSLLNKGISSGVLTEYKPFYSDAEKKAILLQQQNEQARIIEERRKATGGI